MDNNSSYTGYFGRLLGLIIALILFGMAIWFVVRMINPSDPVEEVGVVVTKDDATDSQSVVSNLIGDNEIAVDTSTDSETLIAATDQTISETSSSQSSTTTVATVDSSNLPDTGPADTVMLSIGIVALGLATKNYLRSRRDLQTAYYL